MRDFSEEINNSLDLLFKLEKQQPKNKNLLDKGKQVYLQVILFRIPNGPPKKRKFLKLRHSLYGEDPDICLFVPNRKTDVEYKKTTDEFIDFCVDYYTELLEKHKVKGITTVMPLKQLKSEYGTYELRRKLVRRFDLFLCKNSLLYNSRFLTSLGKIFRVANKEPFGISFPKEDVDYDPEFQKNIDKVLYCTSFFINRFSDHYSIPIGKVTNTKTELKENLEEVLKQILTQDVIPGGFKNIRAMHLWPSQSKKIPFYICTEFPADLKTPRVLTKKSRKRTRGVGGEISSQPHKKVFVMPSGEVFVTNLKQKKEKKVEPESEDDDSLDEGSEVEEDERKENNKMQNMKKEEDESESEDDEDIEKKEAKLLEEKMEENQESEPESNAEDEEVVTKTKKKNPKVKAKKAQRKSNIKKEKFKAKEKQKAKLKKKT